MPKGKRSSLVPKKKKKEEERKKERKNIPFIHSLFTGTRGFET